MPEKIRFFPLDVTYKVIDNKPVIHLYGRIENGPQICVLDDSFEPYFYVVAKEGAEIREKLEKLSVTQNNEISYVTKAEQVSKEYLGKKISAIKVFTKLPRDVPVIREIVKEWEMIESADVSAATLFPGVARIRLDICRVLVTEEAPRGPAAHPGAGGIQPVADHSGL